MSQSWIKIVRMSASGILLLVFGWWGWNWLGQYQEFAAIRILAAHDVPENGMPVFAQFIVTQTLRVEEPFEATKIVVPIYWPEETEELQIDLRRNGKLVQRWRRQGEAGRTWEEVFEINPAVWLDGDLEVVFNGSKIAHENQARAPRVFVEKADPNYPDGHYWIAENNKEGDVEMKLVGRSMLWEKMWSGYKEAPLLGIRDALMGLLGVWFIIAFPGVVLDDLIYFFRKILRRTSVV